MEDGVTFLERPMVHDSNDVVIWRGDGVSGNSISNLGSGGSSYDLVGSGASVTTGAAPFWSSFNSDAEFYQSANMAFGVSLTSGITISCWIYTSAPSSLDRIIIKQNNATWAGSPIYPVGLIMQGSTEVRAVVNDAAAQVVATSVGVGAWHHAGLTVNAAQDTLEFYVDGISKGADTISGGLDLDNDNGPWCLGGRTNSNFFGGNIWDARIATTVRPAAWFQNSYVRGLRFFGTYA